MGNTVYDFAGITLAVSEGQSTYTVREPILHLTEVMIVIRCREVPFSTISALKFTGTLGFLGEKRQGELVVRAVFIHGIVANFLN
jgi:hypothetical protein